MCRIYSSTTFINMINLFLKLVIFLLPAIVLADDIKVEITGMLTNEMDQIQVKASGGESCVIPDKDIKVFQMNERNLKDGVEKVYGCRPDDVFLKSPTPWGDLYKTYKWQEVTRVIKIIDAKILKAKNQPAIIFEHDLDNPHDVDMTYNTNIEQQYKNTMSIGWSKNSEVSVQSSFSVSVNVGATTNETSYTESHTSSFGTNSEKTTEATTITSSSVQVSAKPGQHLLIQLRTTWKQMVAQVTYMASCYGYVAANYSKKCKNRHFMAYDVNNVMEGAGLPTEVEMIATVSVGFYGKTFMSVIDKNNKD